MMKYLFVVSIFMFVAALSAQDKNEWLLESGVTFNHFQQQVKAEVGDPRGQRLLNIFELGLNLSATYKWNEWLAAGLFLRVDRGQRDMAAFNGFDADGKTVIKDKLGGTYSELWFGPLVQVFWKQLGLELGYAVVGLRKDFGRPDIPNQSGEKDGVFSLNPSVAWLVNFSGFFPINDHLDVSLKAEYRGRYYLERGGKKLINNIYHGTQSIVPVIGIRWHLK